MLPLSTLSKTSLSVRHTSVRITSEVNNNNLFSTWIQVFWNVMQCSWMRVPDFTMHCLTPEDKVTHYLLSTHW